jgi:hypothetical protein
MSRYRTKHTDTQVIILNENDDAAFYVEVEFTITPGQRGTWTQPDDPPEIEIIRVRPYTTRKLYPGEVGYGVNYSSIEKTVWLDCPRWLEALLFDAVDPDMLDAEGLDLDRYR